MLMTIDQLELSNLRLGLGPLGISHAFIVELEISSGNVNINFKMKTLRIRVIIIG